MHKRAAIYVRVSTDRQTVENQLRELRQIAERRGWEVVKEYDDAGISGAKGRDDRPGLDEMLKDAQRRRFDVVMAWAIDRVGRSLIDLLGTIQQLESCGVDLYLDQQAIDTTTPAGRLMFQITGAFAEFERSMIRQRIRAGLKRAWIRANSSDARRSPPPLKNVSRVNCRPARACWQRPRLLVLARALCSALREKWQQLALSRTQAQPSREGQQALGPRQLDRGRRMALPPTTSSLVIRLGSSRLLQEPVVQINLDAQLLRLISQLRH
jgi:DNA invertase Pin-like site-specific DNA recombinase